MKKEVLDVMSKHQVDMLGKYFPVDHKRKIVTIKIYYDKASDMLDFTVGELHMELFSNQVFEKITDIVSNIPPSYKADIIFVVDDYQGYDPKLLLQKLNDKIEINNYVLIKDRRKKWLITVALILVGLGLLFFLQLGKRYNIFGSGIKADIITEAIDIISWVFIWEAVTVLFLSPSELGSVQINMLKRVSKISFSSKNEKVLLKEKMDDVVEIFTSDSRMIDILNVLLLVTSTFMIISATYSLIVSSIERTSDLQELLSTKEKNNVFAILISLFSMNLLTVFNKFFIGVLGIRRYKSKNVNNLLLYILLLFDLVLTVATFVLSTVIVETSSMVVAGLDFIMLVVFIYTAMKIDRLRKEQAGLKKKKKRKK